MTRFYYKRSFNYLLAGASLFIALNTANAQLSPFKQAPFEPLNGAYAVGTEDYVWIDKSRAETAYSDDPNVKRHLRIKVWYPAEKQDHIEPAPYLPSLDEFGTPELFRGLASLPSRSYPSVPIAQKKSGYPILIYSHGGGWSRFSASFVTEEMASQGYIVVAIDHTGFNQSTRFLNDYQFKDKMVGKIDFEAMQSPEKVTQERYQKAVKNYMKYLEGIFLIWRDDATYVLDQLEVIRKSNETPWSSHLDMDRVAMFGWSFGGGLAIEMTQHDSRVKAGVNHDGRLFGGVVSSGSSHPIMIMHNSSWHQGDLPNERATMDELAEMTDRMLAKSNADWFEIDFKNLVGHGNFSDLSLFGDVESEEHKALKQQVHPTRIHKVIIDYTRAFFNKYLKGEDSPLLNGPAAGYPEVKYKSNKSP